jgi:predicted house-cleaning noncanonical NTP pyrophosphatase (MazG superfamily)
MEFEKLVRDKIAKIIKKQGRTPVFHIASDEEYYRGLKAKLREEVEEFIKSNHIDELADLLEVIYTICEFKGVSREDLNNRRRKKNEERGKFLDRVILETIREEGR